MVNKLTMPLKLCPRGEWEDRILVETVLSMLTLVCHFKKVMHRVCKYSGTPSFPSSHQKKGTFQKKLV